MTTAVDKTQCFLCKKDTRTFSCEGCSQNFCLNCLTKHVQKLSQQLDEIENDHDQFQQKILQEKDNLKNHLLIQEINQWETDSINKIKQTAEQSRLILNNYTSKSIIEIENKLNILAQEIKRSREEKEFTEIDLNLFIKKLKILKDELDQPPKASIEQQSTTFINKIVVIVPNYDGNKSIVCELKIYF